MREYPPGLIDVVERAIRELVLPQTANEVKSCRYAAVNVLDAIAGWRGE
jgi:hypothetical protein